MPSLSGSLNFITYFYFPTLKQLIINVSYCLISINNNLLAVTCYWSLVVSGLFVQEMFLIHTSYLISVVEYFGLIDVKIKGNYLLIFIL